MVAYGRVCHNYLMNQRLNRRIRRRDAIIPRRWWSRPSLRGPSTRSRGATSIPTPSRSCTGCTSTTTSRISSAAACATCCSAAGRRISTSARRRIRTRSRSCSATAGSSAGASASRTSSSGPRRSRSRRSAPGRSLGAAAERSRRTLEAAPERAPIRRTRRTSRRSRKARTWPGARARSLIHRDNTFGTPEEDAFRRDFTINALFYDIGTFSIIDYVGGLEDLEDAADPLDRRSRACASSRTRSACCARSSSRRASTSTSISRSSRRSRRTATRSPAARRRACSRSTSRFCARARRRRASASCKQTELLRAITPELDAARAGALGIDGAARSLSRAFRRRRPTR